MSKKGSGDKRERGRKRWRYERREKKGKEVKVMRRGGKEREAVDG